MAKKTEEKKSEKIERVYVIPLREKVRSVPRYKKTPKAVKTIKEFLVRHMKIRDRDLNKIKIDSYLNEEIWMRGIKKPAHKIKVRVVKENDIVRVYSAALPEKINFKKARHEKIEAEGKAALEKKKTLAEKAKDVVQGKKENATEKAPEKTDEEKKDETEKEKSSMIAEEKLQKETAKTMKHTTKVKTGNEKLAEKKGRNAMSRGH
jgi:large subunit ribosomal protein L31e